MKFALIQIMHAACELTVLINGVPVYRQGGSGESQVFVNEWMLASDNRIVVRIDWPKEVPYVPRLASASVRVLALESGQTASEAKAVFELAWPGDAPEAYPYQRGAALVFANATPTALGKKTVVVEKVTAADREVFFAQLQQLRNLFMAKDWTGAGRLLSFKFEDMDNAYGQDRGATQSNAAEALQAASSSGEWALENFSLEEVTTQIVADGHLVAVSRVSGHPLIQTPPSAGISWALPVFFAKIDGAWLILR